MKWKFEIRYSDSVRFRGAFVKGIVNADNEKQAEEIIQKHTSEYPDGIIISLEKE